MSFSGRCTIWSPLVICFVVTFQRDCIRLQSVIHALNAFTSWFCQKPKTKSRVAVFRYEDSASHTNDTQYRSIFSQDQPGQVGLRVRRQVGGKSKDHLQVRLSLSSWLQLQNEWGVPSAGTIAVVHGCGCTSCGCSYSALIHNLPKS